MSMKDYLKSLVSQRNGVAHAINETAEKILSIKSAAEEAHKSDCPCRSSNAVATKSCTDAAFEAKMAEIEGFITEQKQRRSEVERLDELIDASSELADRDEPVEETLKSLKSGLIGGELLEVRGKKREMPLMQEVGTAFHHFLRNQANIKSASDLRNRAGGVTELLPDGRMFQRAASFHTVFGKNTTETAETTKSIGGELGLGSEFLEKMKTRREATKSMFTQHPLAGGDGDLYAPTEVFAGNTGGLCEFMIDNEMEVLPYPEASFLGCMRMRSIPKSYVLFARQTLRINNASGVGEGVFLDDNDNPTGAPVDFRPLKPESKFGFSQAKAYTIPYADTLEVSEEFLEDCPAVADAVETQLMENVRQAFYNDLINGDGSGGEYPEILGLLGQIGLSTRVHRGAAAYMGNTRGAGAADDNIRETIERAIFDARAYGYNVDCVIISDEDYIKMHFLKDELGHRLYEDGQLMTILGANVYADVRMPAGTAIAGAFGQVVQVLMRRSMRLDVGYVNEQFRQDMLTLRAVMNAGLMVKVPHALIRITALA